MCGIQPVLSRFAASSYALLRSFFRYCNRGALAVVIGLGVAGQHSAGYAVLIDQGLTTLDTATGLEWLDMSQSVGISAQAIIDGTDPSNLSGDGWGLASVTEITTLLLNGGMTGPFNGSLTPSNYAAASSIIALLGMTGMTNLDFIQSFAAEGPVTGVLFTPALLVSSPGCVGCIGGADVPGPGVPSTVQNPTIGNWLVRSASTSVSEPNVVALTILALAGIGFSRRRKLH